MFKRMLSIMSVIFAMCLMLMGPVAATDFNSFETPMVSVFDTGIDPGVPINDVPSFPILSAAITSLEKIQTHRRFDFVTEHRNIAVGPNVQGGGFSLALGSKANFFS